MLYLKVNFKKKYEHNLNCPFCSVESEHFDHIFMCPAGIYAPKSIRSIKLKMLGNISDIHLLSSDGKFLLRYEKYGGGGGSFVRRTVLSLSAVSC